MDCSSLLQWSTASLGSLPKDDKKAKLQNSERAQTDLEVIRRLQKLRLFLELHLYLEDADCGVLPGCHVYPDCIAG